MNRPNSPESSLTAGSGLSRLALLLAAGVGVASAVQAAGAPAQFGDRPRVGLVLAGGGAKGGAHIGVIKVLEELRVPVDCIAGTSMGALVGGGYAAGLPAAELEKFVTGIDWNTVIGGEGSRQRQPIEQKRNEGVAGSGFEVGLKEDGIVTPGGFVDTAAIDDLLRVYVASGRNAENFDALPIPFRAVATDMVRGEMVVLDRGDLATAMRASMAIPGAFAPVIGEGRVLADGGMVRNIPVDIARQTCADVVIVVNLVEPETPPEKLVQATQLISRSMDVMLQLNEIAQLQTLNASDIRIDVPMGDIGTSSFERIPETIPLGEKAAREVTDRLAALAVPDAQYVAWRERVTTAQQVQVKLADVRYEGLTWVNPKFLETRTRLRAGDTADLTAISADARLLSALEELDSVAYRLEGDPAAPTLVWTPAEASVGPVVLRPGLGIYASGGGDLKFQAGVQHVQRWVNDRGAQWRNQLQVGYETAAKTSFYQPLDIPQQWFVEPGLVAKRTTEDLYNDGNRVAVYRFYDTGGQVDLGWNASRDYQFRTGYWISQRRSRVDTGTELLPEVDLQDAGLIVSGMYDSRDNSTFNSDGLVTQFEFVQSNESLGAERDWQRLEIGAQFSVPLIRNIVQLSIAGGTDLGTNLPADRTFSLGGARTLPAYQLDELRAGEYWLVSASFLWRLFDISPVRGQALYLGMGLQGAGIYDRVDPVDDGEIAGISAYVGGPTPIGAFTIGTGYSGDKWGFWLSIGRPIGKGSILDSGLLR